MSIIYGMMAAGAAGCLYLLMMRAKVKTED
jgi:hypothetical protein